MRRCGEPGIIKRNGRSVGIELLTTCSPGQTSASRRSLGLGTATMRVSRSRWRPMAMFHFMPTLLNIKKDIVVWAIKKNRCSCQAGRVSANIARTVTYVSGPKCYPFIGWTRPATPERGSSFAERRAGWSGLDARPTAIESVEGRPLTVAARRLLPALRVGRRISLYSLPCRPWRAAPCPRGVPWPASPILRAWCGP